MKNLLILTMLFTLASCAQIEKATEKWKTPVTNSPSSTNQQTAPSGDNKKHEAKSNAKKKKPATPQIK